MRACVVWIAFQVLMAASGVIASANAAALRPGMKAGTPATDAEFFAAVNLNGPGLVKVKQQVQVEDWKAARREFYEYVRAKFRRADYYHPPQITQRKVIRDDDWLHSDLIQWWIEAGEQRHGLKGPLEALARMAEEIASRGHIVFHSTGRSYSFDPAKPFDYADFDPHGREYHEDLQLYAMYDLTLLRDQYFRTGKRIYLDRSQEVFASYCKWYLGGAGSQIAVADRQNFEHPWEHWTLPRRLWAYLRFLSLLQNADLDSDLVIDVCKAILEDERLHVSRGPTWGGNFRQYMCTDGAMVAGVFFEFKESPDWFADQVARLVAGSADIQPDGSTSDLSTSYTEGYVLWLSALDTLLHAFDSPLKMAIPPDAKRRYEATFDWQIAMRKPGGLLDAQFNDTGETQPAWFFGKLAGRLFDYFGREDLRWFATRGREGRPPAQASFPRTSVAPNYAGMLAMRSDWTDQARYLVVDFGPLGGHSHPDYGSFLLHAYGASLIDEGGCAAYGSEPYTKYSRSPWAHNIVTIDGASQPPDRPPLGQPVRNWITNEAFDYAWGQSDFGALDRQAPTTSAAAESAPRFTGVLHRRAIYFAKPDYFLLLDAIDGGGEHRVRSKLQLWWDVSAIIHGARALARSATGPSLHIVPFDDRPIPAIVTGQKEPWWDGWVTRLPHSAEVVPAPAVIYEEVCRFPIRRQTLLYPVATGKTATLKTERIAADDGRDGVLLVVEPSDRSYRDEFLVSYGPGPLSFSSEQRSSEAKMVHLRVRGQRMERIGFIGASRLRHPAVGEIAFDQPTDGYIELKPDGGLHRATVCLDPSNRREVGRLTVRPPGGVESTRTVAVGRSMPLE